MSDMNAWLETAITRKLSTIEDRGPTDRVSNWDSNPNTDL